MSELLKRLRDQRLRVWEQSKELLESVEAEKRSFDATETKTWDSLNAELDAVDERIKKFVKSEKRSAETEKAFADIESRRVEAPVTREPSAAAPSAEDTRKAELRRFLNGETKSYTVMPSGPIDFRTLSVGTTTAGGYTVPTDFYNRLVAHLIQTSAIMQAGPTVINTAGGENVQVPKTTSHSTAALVSEGAAISASDPAFGQYTLGAWKYGLLIQLSRELLEDTGVDIEGYLSMQAGRALGNAVGADFVTGNGTSKPRGVTIDASTGVTGGTGVTGAFTADNIIDLYYSVIPQYRASQSCMWVMRDTTVGAVRKLKDSQNRYLWEPSVQVGQPDMLLGKPVLTDPNVAATGLSAKSVVFGDFSQYFVRLASGLRFERSDEYAFNTDLVTFRALLRADGALIDLTGAVKQFVGGAS